MNTCPDVPTLLPTLADTEQSRTKPPSHTYRVYNLEFPLDPGGDATCSFLSGPLATCFAHLVSFVF